MRTRDAGTPQLSGVALPVLAHALLGLFVIITGCSDMPVTGGRALLGMGCDDDPPLSAAANVVSDFGQSQTNRGIEQCSCEPPFPGFSTAGLSEPQAERMEAVGQKVCDALKRWRNSTTCGDLADFGDQLLASGAIKGSVTYFGDDTTLAFADTNSTQEGVILNILSSRLDTWDIDELMRHELGGHIREDLGDGDTNHDSEWNAVNSPGSAPYWARRNCGPLQ
jgi:hypothetical protein